MVGRRPVGGRHALQDAGVQWRRRNAWMRRESVALLVAAGSIVIGALVVGSPLRVGVRQGISFFLICVLAVAIVVALVRHTPLPVLHYGQSVTLVLTGAVLTVLSDPPIALLGVAVAILGLALLVAKVYLHRTARSLDEPEGRPR